jgi:hypothetical protein
VVSGGPSPLASAQSVSWQSPPFCRVSWTSDASRQLWEPRLFAARDAIEELSVLRSAEDKSRRILFVRPVSVPRMTELARTLGLSMRKTTAEPGPHDVAAGRAGRIALSIGSEAAPASEPAGEFMDPDEDPVWRLARGTPAARAFDEGRGLVATGNWASNPLLAAVGLAAVPFWPQSFACPRAEGEGEALLQFAAAHGRDEAIDHLRQALCWPASWTSLHGAAEIKTPVFRFIRNAPFSGRRLSVRHPGTEVPEGAARGLGFPFGETSANGEALWSRW